MRKEENQIYRSWTSQSKQKHSQNHFKKQKVLLEDYDKLWILAHLYQFACVLRETQNLDNGPLNNRNKVTQTSVSAMKLLQRYDSLLNDSFAKLSQSVKIDESLHNSVICQTNRLINSGCPSFIKKFSQQSQKEHTHYLTDTIDSEENSKSFEGMCYVHSDNRSQYRIKRNGNYLEICKKCAVKFASRGIKTQIITSGIEQTTCSLDQQSKDKLVEKYIKKMELDWLLTKIKLLEQKINDKKKLYRSILCSHEKKNEVLKALYQVLKKQLSKTWDFSQKQFDLLQSKGQNWRITTIQAVVIIQKVIKDIQKRILELPFAKEGEQSSIQSCRFYKDSLIFHDHQCNQLDFQTQQLKITKQNQSCLQLKKFLRNKEAVLQNISVELKCRKRL